MPRTKPKARSPRPVSLRTRDKISARLQEYWADPEWRAAQCARLAAGAARRWARARGEPIPARPPKAPRNASNAPEGHVWRPRYVPVPHNLHYAFSAIVSGPGPKFAMDRRCALLTLVAERPALTELHYARLLWRVHSTHYPSDRARARRLVKRDLAALRALRLVYTT